MKVKIAMFDTAGGVPILFDHEPVTKGWYQKTEWIEVELPELSAEAIESNRLAAVAAERADLEKRLAALK